MELLGTQALFRFENVCKCPKNLSRLLDSETYNYVNVFV